MTDKDLLRRILGAMRPDVPLDWHDNAWLAAKGLDTLEAIERDAAPAEGLRFKHGLEVGRSESADNAARTDVDSFGYVSVEHDGERMIGFGSWNAERSDPLAEPRIGRAAPAVLRIDLDGQGLALNLFGPPWSIENVRRIIEQLERIVEWKEDDR